MKAFCILLFLTAAPVRAEEIKPSPYSSKLHQLSKTLESSAMQKLLAADELRLQCFTTEGNRFYIGVAESVRIHAPVEVVAGILDRFEDYPKLFPDLKEVKVISKSADTIRTEWRQAAPAFFLSDTRYALQYQVTNGTQGHRVYFYELVSSKDLKNFDGFIDLSPAKDNPKETQYFEIDFFDAHWGMAETLAPGRIWKDSVAGIAWSDLALKRNAEHPGESPEESRKISKKELKDEWIEKCIQSKTSSDLVWSR